MSLTLHTLHRGQKHGQKSPTQFKMFINLTKDLEDPMRELKWRIESQLKTSISWTVFFLYAADALTKALNEGKAPALDVHKNVNK